MPAVKDTLMSLKSTAALMREAVLKGDVAEMGKHLGDYWEQKKLMAPGAEPPLVKALLDAVRVRTPPRLEAFDLEIARYLFGLRD